MTIRWAMRLLLAHPEAFHKLRAEIDSKVGNERLLNESDFTNLPYLQCVINETLRLYPPVPLLLPQYSLEDCTIGGNDVPKYTITLGPSIGTPRYGMSLKSLSQRDLRVWKGKKKGSIINLCHLKWGEGDCAGAACNGLTYCFVGFGFVDSVV
ncbi:hypothetical protein AABB24_008418 [Solanum stoloniferum]|uniref:Cytochrome P450 n=1 Tax=Solanum stoloniferum TaxID=62892 RepID=A0ABD2USR1_9SOLN